MIYNDPKELAILLATTGERHVYYDRVVKLADDYMTIISGEGIERFLSQFVRREDQTMFAQRVALTKAITPAVASSLMKPFNKVSRNDKIKKKFDFKDKVKNANVQTMIDRFYGDSTRKSRGLDYWLKTRYPELVFADPNSWIVLEWETPQTEAEVITPYPFEISSRDALNYHFDGEELQWLFIQTAITYVKLNDKKELEEKEGISYTLYEKNQTVVIRQIDKATFEAVEEFDQNTQSLIEINGNDFLVTVLSPNLGYVPAVRVGYNRDIYTGGRTYVNPFHEAMCYFEKSIKTVSELDLTMTLHAFPQKLQYVDRCEGTPEQACSSGYIAGTSQKCPVCEGTGFKKIATTAQDAITLPMPEEGAENVLKLAELVEYKAPPVELIRFQKEYVYDLKKDAHMAVFNSTVFIQEQAQVAQTATEVDTNMQSIYDTLEPYTEKYSEIWKEFVYTFAKLTRVAKPEDGDIIHIFPSDLKLKTTTILLQEMKTANESGAPSFFRDQLTSELADVVFAGDPLERKKYETKRRFFPFNGKTPDEIAVLMASQYVSKFTKILYSNFEAIFEDILIEKPEFIMMNSHAKQWEILQAKVKEFAEEIDSQNPLPTLDFGTDTDPEVKNQKDGEKPEGNIEEEEE